MLPKFIKSISDDTNRRIRDTYAKAGRNDVLKIKQLRHHKFELSFVRIYTTTTPTSYEYKCKLNEYYFIRCIIFQTTPHFFHKLHLIHIRYIGTYMKAILLPKKCKCVNLHWVYEVHIKKNISWPVVVIAVLDLIKRRYLNSFSEMLWRWYLYFFLSGTHWTGDGISFV